MLNQRSKIENQPGYLVILGRAEKSAKQLEIFVFDASEEKLPLFKEILPVKEIYSEDDTTLSRIVINPTDEQFMRLIDSQVYVPCGTYERIKQQFLTTDGGEPCRYFRPVYNSHK